MQELSVIKRHGAWKSSNVAEGYVDDSLDNKKKICKLLVGGEDQENTQIEKKINLMKLLLLHRLRELRMFTYLTNCV
jgi:hypothetical protein